MKTDNGQSKYCIYDPIFIIYVVRSVNASSFDNNILISLRNRTFTSSIWIDGEKANRDSENVTINAFIVVIELSAF